MPELEGAQSPDRPDSKGEGITLDPTANPVGRPADRRRSAVRGRSTSVGPYELPDGTGPGESMPLKPNTEAESVGVSALVSMDQGVGTVTN
jgi:hypothetical protein